MVARQEVAMGSLKQWKVMQAALVVALALSAPAFAQVQAAGADSAGGAQGRWLASWTSAQMAPGPNTIDAIFGGDRSRILDNQTVRNVVHISIGGRRVRVRFSNAFGTEALRIGAAQVALRSSRSAILAGSSRRLTFSGQASILVPAGALAVSDPVDLDVPGAADLAVSVYLPSVTEAATYHEQTGVTSYIAGPGNFVAATDVPVTEETTATYYLSMVEVLPSDTIRAVVAFGDSITQGFGSSPDQYRTWPDRLSARLNPNPLRPRLAVLNQGVGCGRLLWDFCGPSGAARFERDVLTVPGVSHVIVHLGLNDITIPSILPIFGHPEFAPEAVSAQEIIVGLHQLILRAHAQGLRIVGSTITPIGASTVPGVFTPENEASRQAINRWIRTSGAFDGFVDFDAAVRDPSNPTRLLPAYDFDGLHLTDAGYQAMANAINLSLLF
jgi:lysophospholipase L1-like esterase